MNYGLSSIILIWECNLSEEYYAVNYYLINVQKQLPRKNCVSPVNLEKQK